MRTFLALSLLALPACGAHQACTLIGCSDAVTVRFEGTLPDGSYTIELADADTQPYTCLVVIDGGAPSPSEDCALEVVLVDGSLEATAIGFAPAELDVGLVHIGGDSLIDEVITPSYETQQPNGEDCPPTCSFAYETATLPATA